MTLGYVELDLLRASRMRNCLEANRLKVIKMGKCPSHGAIIFFPVPFNHGLLKELQWRQSDVENVLLHQPHDKSKGPGS